MPVARAIMMSMSFGPSLADAPPRECAREVGATGFVTRLAGVPQKIRDDLVMRVASAGSKLADSDVPLLQTDAPTERERGHAQVRFAQAMLVRDKWLVQLEVSLIAGVRTLTYDLQHNGSFQYSREQLFNGPACASIKAVLAGVMTPAPF